MNIKDLLNELTSKFDRLEQHIDNLEAVRDTMKEVESVLRDAADSIKWARTHIEELMDMFEED